MAKSILLPDNLPSSVTEYIRRGQELLRGEGKAQTYYTLRYEHGIILEPQRHHGSPGKIHQRVHHWEYWLYPHGCVPDGVLHRCGVIMNKTLRDLNYNLGNIQGFETMYKSFKRVDSLPKNFTSHNVLGPIAYILDDYRRIKDTPYYWRNDIEHLSVVTFRAAINLFIQFADLWLHRTRPSKLNTCKTYLTSYADTLYQIISLNIDLENSRGFNIYNDLELLEAHREQIKIAVDQINPREDCSSDLDRPMTDDLLETESVPLPLILVGTYHEDSDQNKWQSYTLKIDENKISCETDFYQKSYILGLWPHIKTVRMPKKINCNVRSVRSVQLIKDPPGVSLAMIDTKTPMSVSTLGLQQAQNTGSLSNRIDLRLEDPKTSTRVYSYINDILVRRNNILVRRNNILVRRNNILRRRNNILLWRSDMNIDANIPDLEIAKKIVNDHPIIRAADSIVQKALFIINNARHDLSTRVDAFCQLSNGLGPFGHHISFDNTVEYQIAKPSLEYPLHICKDDLKKLIEVVSAKGSSGNFQNKFLKTLDLHLTSSDNNSIIIGDLQDEFLKTLDLHLTSSDNNSIIMSDMGALVTTLNILSNPVCPIITMGYAAIVGLKMLKAIFPKNGDPLHWNKMKDGHKKQVIKSMKMTTFRQNVETNPSESSVQALYLYILDTIGCEPNNQYMIMSSDTIRCVVMAMRTYLHNKEIQLHAYKILSVIALSTSHYTDIQTMKSFNPAEHVLTAMKTYSDDLDIQRDGFDLLINIEAPMTIINDALRSHREATPEDLEQLSKRFASLEIEATDSRDSEFFYLRGNYYYKMAQKQTDRSVKDIHLGHALADCKTSLRHNPNHTESLRLIPIIEKESAEVMNSKSLKLKDLTEEQKARVGKLEHSDLTEEEKLEVERLDESNLTEEEKAEVNRLTRDAKPNCLI